MLTFWDIIRFRGGTKKIIDLLGISFKTQEQIIVTIWWIVRFFNLFIFYYYFFFGGEGIGKKRRLHLHN